MTIGTGVTPPEFVQGMPGVLREGAPDSKPHTLKQVNEQIRTSLSDLHTLCPEHSDFNSLRDMLEHYSKLLEKKDENKGYLKALIIQLSKETAQHRQIDSGDSLAMSSPQKIKEKIKENNFKSGFSDKLTELAASVEALVE